MPLGIVLGTFLATFIAVNTNRHCRGNTTLLYRYADDFVCCFEQVSDAQRFYDVLPKRLAKFGLEVAEDKTQLHQFHKGSKHRFSFLGFEYYWGAADSAKPC